jgi:hypothetical protein
VYRKNTYHLGTLTCEKCKDVVPRKTANQRFCQISCRLPSRCKGCDGPLPRNRPKWFVNRPQKYCNDDCRPPQTKLQRRIDSSQCDYISPPPTKVELSEEQTWDRISHWCAVYHENISETFPGHTTQARNNKLAWYITYCQFAEEVTEEDEIVARSLFRV